MSSRALSFLVSAVCLAAAEGSGLPNPAFLAPYQGARDYAVRSSASAVTATYWVAAPAQEVLAYHNQLLTQAGFAVSAGSTALSGAGKNQLATVQVQQSDLGTNVYTRYATGASASALASQARAAEAAAAPGSAYSWPRFLKPPPGDEFPRAPDVSNNERGERTMRIEFGSGEDVQTIVGFYEQLFRQNGLQVCCSSMNTAKTLDGKTGFKSGHTEGTQWVDGARRKVEVSVDRGNLYSYFKVTLEVKVTPASALEKPRDTPRITSTGTSSSSRPDTKRPPVSYGPGGIYDGSSRRVPTSSRTRQ
ncbi:MAG: hypothetical protein U0Q16_26405 [Bryobacteraceae bacterium]